MVKQASNVFTGDLIELIDNIRRDKEQKIDHDSIDEVIRAEWANDSIENAGKLVEDFSDYLKANKNEIDALEIFFDQPHRRRDITYDMIREVMNKLKSDKPALAPLRIWQAYSQLDDYKGQRPINELTALVALVRRVSEIDNELSTFDATVRKNFQRWVMKQHEGGEQKFTEEQMEWLRMIRNHVVNSFHIERDDLEMAPFGGYGGLGKMYQLFGAGMDSLLEQLNDELVA